MAIMKFSDVDEAVAIAFIFVFTFSTATTERRLKLLPQLDSYAYLIAMAKTKAAAKVLTRQTVLTKLLNSECP